MIGYNPVQIMLDQKVEITQKTLFPANPIPCHTLSFLTCIILLIVFSLSTGRG